MGQIRHFAICVFRDRNRILVAPGYDDVKNERFFRPLGGGVEFGETAEEALRCEIREELGFEIRDVVRFGVIENGSSSADSRVTKSSLYPEGLQDLLKRTILRSTSTATWTGSESEHS